MRVLWLTSWYPNKHNTMNGNFVLRHALATSIYCSVHLIHVECVIAKPDKNVERTMKLSETFSQNIFYVYAGNKIQRLLLFWRYLQTYKRTADQYCKQKGKPELVHVNVPYKAGLIAVYLKLRYKIPFVVTEHFGIYREGTGSFKYRSLLFRFITKLICKNAAHLISPSNFAAKGINQMVASVPYTVIRNTVHTDLFHTRPQGRIFPNFRFLHISTLNENKNPKGIIHAFDRLFQENKNVELIIAGELKPELIEYAGQFESFSCIQFKAELSYHAVADEMRSADVFILFSFYENSPCVIGEAFCCGLPVIASDTGGVAELVNAKNGILVTPGDEYALCNAMQTMIMGRQNFDPQQIGREAAATFGFPVIGAQIHNVYKKCLE